MNKWPTGRRQFRRYLTNLPITVSLRESDLQGYCNQIAAGGLRALFPQSVPVESTVLLQFRVPTEEGALRTLAVVRYQVGFQHGLQFVSLSEEERQSIRRLCAASFRQPMKRDHECAAP